MGLAYEDSARGLLAGLAREVGARKTRPLRCRQNGPRFFRSHAGLVRVWRQMVSFRGNRTLQPFAELKGKE